MAGGKEDTENGLNGGYKELADSKVQEFQPNRMIGLMWVFVVGLITLATTAVTSLASNTSVPNYTQNFLRCFAAATTLRVVTLSRGESVGLKKDYIQPCVSFGLADWFFLWGYVKALIGISVLQFACLGNATGPLIVAIMGFVFLKEQPSGYKMFALIRNVLLAPLIVNPFDGSTPYSQLLVGLFWVTVAGCGTGTMRLLQRANNSVPGTVLTFWGYCINTLLWFPPGSIPPQLRVPILWPHVQQDENDIFATSTYVWCIMLLSGVLGAGIMVVQGWALRHLDVATYSVIVTPLCLVLSTVYSAIQKPLETLTWVGVTLQVLALLMDMYQDKNEQAK